MANYADTVLLAARAKQEERYRNKFEGRPENTFLMDMFLKNRSITIPQLQDIRRATTQTTSTLYQVNPSFILGDAKSCDPTAQQADSGKVDLTWSKIVGAFTTSMKRHDGNEYSMIEDVAWGLLRLEMDMLKNDATNGMDAILAAYLDTNRTQVNAASTGGINTWDGVNFNMDVALADINDYYNSVLSEMHLNNYSGNFLEAYNTTWEATARQQVNQGQANATNLQFQYQNPFGFEGFASNLLTPSAGNGSVHYVVPENGVALLDWNEPLNVRGDSNGDESWGLYESRMFPGIFFDLFTKVACTDTSASGGSTQDKTIKYELTLNYSIVKQPLSTANETPIFKYEIANT
jgi:hypothetical protein